VYGPWRRRMDIRGISTQSTGVRDDNPLPASSSEQRTERSGSEANYPEVPKVIDTKDLC
jgi:hypothetical protein